MDKGDLSGRTLGTCVLEKLIGQGGMGAVYLARQTRPARNVAVKVLLPGNVMSNEVYQAFLARFRREADVIAKLEHVNIMPIYEYGEQDGIAYLVMPYLTGGSLRDILTRRGPLSIREAITYIDQAASALDYAHAHGVVHRDLKPANFLLYADGRLVLADFGIARMLEDSPSGATLTGTGMIVGTPEYMAPEMASGEPVDYRADIYELGVVLFQMMSGQVPFRGNTPFAIVTKHLQEPLPLLHQINPALPVEIDQVVQKATAKRREDRYSSAGALAQDLRRVTGSQSSTLNTYDEALGPDAPTFISASDSNVVPATQKQSNMPPPLPTQKAYETPPPSQQPLYNTPSVPPPPPTYASSSDPNWPSMDPYGGYPPSYPTYGTPPPAYPTYSTPPPTPTKNRQPLLIIIGVLLALLLTVGGVLVGLQLSRGTTGTNPTSNNPSQATATVNATATALPTATPSPRVQPTTAPTVKPTTAPTQPSTLALGRLIYAAASPGTGCDSGGGKWVSYNSAQVACQGGSTRISNTQQAASLVGTLLEELPGQTFPSNYIIQVQLQQDASSSTDFGVYFRNQPGNQEGVYTFLIHSNGSWSAYVYDNTTGNPTEIAKGNAGDSHASLTIDVSVVGSHFAFYANGASVGSTNDTTYASGTIGLAVDQGGTITASNFALYAPA